MYSQQNGHVKNTSGNCNSNYTACKRWHFISTRYNKLQDGRVKESSYSRRLCLILSLFPAMIRSVEPFQLEPLCLRCLTYHTRSQVEALAPLLAQLTLPIGPTRGILAPNIDSRQDTIAYSEYYCCSLLYNFYHAPLRLALSFLLWNDEYFVKYICFFVLYSKYHHFLYRTRLIIIQPCINLSNLT